jgi:hypothetical protein
MPLLNRFVTFTRRPACHTDDLWLVLAGAGRVTSRQPAPISRGQDKRLASVHHFSIFSCYIYGSSRTGVRQFQRKNIWVNEIYCCRWDKQIGPKFHSFFVFVRIIQRRTVYFCLFDSWSYFEREQNVVFTWKKMRSISLHGINTAVRQCGQSLRGTFYSYFSCCQILISPRFICDRKWRRNYRRYLKMYLLSVTMSGEV